MQNDNPNKPLNDAASPLPEEQPPLAVTTPVSEASSPELTSIESGEKTSAAPVGPAFPHENFQASSFVAESAKKSHKGLWITVSAAIVALVVIPAAGFGYWYTNMRVADIEYEKAIASVNAMIDAADGIEEYRDSVKDNTTLTTASAKLAVTTLDAEAVEYLKKLSTAKEKAAEFLTNEQALAKLAVMSKDASVKSVYDTNKEIIKNYGRTADEYYRTGHEFMTIIAFCQAGAAALQKPGLTSERFDSDMKTCSERLTLAESLASKKFNDLIYTKYREAFLRFMTYAKDLLSAKTQSQYDKAYAGFTQVQKDIENMDTSRLEEIQPTQLPKDQLNRLKEKLEERRQVFFR